MEIMPVLIMIISTIKRNTFIIITSHFHRQHQWALTMEPENQFVVSVLLSVLNSFFPFPTISIGN